MSRNHKKVVEYRNYYLPNNFPVLLLTGPKWIISPVASSTLHFHNCLELGYCHEGSGTLEFGNGKSFRFSAGDVTCIPRNIPHTTYSDRDALSRWSWIFLQPERLFPTRLFTQSMPHCFSIRRTATLFRTKWCRAVHF